MTIRARVKDGALSIVSATEWCLALAPFEGKEVELAVREPGQPRRRRDDVQALRLAAIEVLLHRACWCWDMALCARCSKAYDRLAELVGMKTPAEPVEASK